MRYRSRAVPFPGYFKPAEVLTCNCKVGGSECVYTEASELAPMWYNDGANGSHQHWQEVAVVVDELHEGPPYKSGGNFDSLKIIADPKQMANRGTYTSTYKCDFKYRACYKQPQKYYQNAVFGPKPSIISLINNNILLDSEHLDEMSVEDFPTSLIDPSTYGPAAWAKYRPGKPGVDLAVSIAELSELPTMLRTTARGFHKLWRSQSLNLQSKKAKKELADQWLNWNFGWIPFMSDLCNFYRTYRTIDKRMKRLADYNDCWERRGGPVATITDSESIVSQSFTKTAHWNGSSQSDFLAGGGAYRLTRRLSADVWFSGKFKYYIPGLGTSKWVQAKYLARQFGLRLNPSVVWNLTPWSWLIDWFSNAGDVISNYADDVENLVAKYAYVMAESRLDYYLWSKAILPMVKPSQIEHTWHYQVKRKSRRGASRYGFNVSSGDLSARQWSILAALKLSLFG